MSREAAEVRTKPNVCGELWDTALDGEKAFGYYYHLMAGDSQSHPETTCQY